MIKILIIVAMIIVIIGEVLQIRAHLNENANQYMIAKKVSYLGMILLAGLFIFKLL